VSKYCLLHGYIAGPSTYTSNNFEQVHAINKARLAQLPETEEFPYLTRGMFALTTGSRTNSFYEMMHFAASIKNLDNCDIKDWVAKFEALLATLVWYEARVQLEIEIDGTYTYSWSASKEGIAHAQAQEPSPVKSWSFVADETDAIPVFTLTAQNESGDLL